MGEYRRNKIKTACDIARRVENWPTAFGMRLRPRRPGLRLLNFRDGLNVACRGGTGDWAVVHELLFAGGYGRALAYLKRQPDKPLVLDLGANIGLFSLLAAVHHPAAEVHAYEPGPPNYRLFEMNCLANAGLSEHIFLHKEAVGGTSRQAEWSFSSENPGASSLFGAGGTAKYAVQIRAFGELLDSVHAPVALLKIDIEGAEYEILRETPPEAWKRVLAVSLELHDDPERTMSQAEFLKRMNGYGFTVEEESVCSFFLHR